MEKCTPETSTNAGPQPDAQVWGNSAERIRKIVVRIERKSAHKETVDRSLPIGHDRTAVPFPQGRPIVIGDAAEHLVEAVLPLRERQLQACTIEDTTSRDLEHGSGGCREIDLVTGLATGIAGDFGRWWTCIETRIRRIAERLLDSSPPDSGRLPNSIGSARPDDTTRSAAEHSTGMLGQQFTEFEQSDQDSTDGGPR